MAVKLRLKRMGAKQSPFYRIVAADSRSPRDGRFIEVIGTYDPIKKPAVITIDDEKALKWLNNGAQPTETVKALFKTHGINKKYADSKAKKTTKKSAKKEEVKEEKKPVAKTSSAKKTTTAKKTTKKA
jgi:small subunit ribosomal protein S16